MKKKYQKLACLLAFFFSFLLISFFYLAINKVSATGLEVNYPSIEGKSLSSDSKMPDFVIYLFNAGMAIGFLSVLISLVIAGVMYFLSPIKPDLRASAKDRFAGAISGLLILFLTYLIIITINPQLNVFSLDELTPTPVLTSTKTPAGIYLYNKSDCSDKSDPNTGNLTDLGVLKNMVNAVKIVPDADTGTSYVSILYDNTDLWGKCKYIDPTISSCQSLNNFAAKAASVSIHEYNSSPNGDGVYFYRKSCFNNPSTTTGKIGDLITQCNNNSGGYYKIQNSSIKNIYVGKLEDLKFTNVPLLEQDCTKYDKEGECTSREIPSLDGKNISSVIINGDYLVLFLYFAQGDTPAGPWTFCQEFPIGNDINKFGPRQIKWENIRNGNEGKIPNWVIIFPIKYL